MIVACLVLWPVIAGAQGAAEQQGFDATAVRPPASLKAVVSSEPLDEAAQARRDMAWEKVVASIKPAKLADGKAVGEAKVAGPAALLIEQAEQATARGDLFGSIRLLREAEALLPQNATIARKLGIAYSLSGNHMRGAAYLERALASFSDDSNVLLLLAQHSATRGELPKTLAYTVKLEKIDASKRLSDYYRAESLKQAGYLSAAADRLSNVLETLADIRLDQEQDANRATLVSRELRVIKTLEPELRLELGDLYLALGQLDKTREVYERIDLDASSDPGAVVDRRVYLSLLSGQVDQAIQQSVAALSARNYARDHDGLIAYLVDQGVSAALISASLEQAMTERGVTLALLRGLAEVADQKRVLTAAKTWLTETSSDPARYRALVELVSFDNQSKEDATPLAELLVMTAKRMAADPINAKGYAEAVVEGVDAMVCLLRALKHDVFVNQLEAQGVVYFQMLAAEAYQQAGRLDDAIAMYQQAMQQAPDAMADARLNLVSLMLERGQLKEAAQTLQQAGDTDSWQTVSLKARILVAMGQSTDAISAVDQWRNVNGQSLESTLLRIDLIAASGEPQRACGELLRMIGTRPKDLRLYEAGLELIEQHQERFNNLNEAQNYRTAFANQLRTNLPDSVPARIELALQLYGNPNRSDQARDLLKLVTQEAPDTARAWLLLAYLHEEEGEHDEADKAYRGFLQTQPPGVARVLIDAERAVTNAEMERASKILLEMFALDQEGVLPGEPMTGDQASTAINLLGAADPKADLEPVSLAMVRRFPNSPKLNNALGYQWAVAGKNLLQAEAMIKRALKHGGNKFEVIDSLAWVQYKLGRFKDAQATQKQAIELLRQYEVSNGTRLTASMAVLSDHMGDIMFRNGDRDAAVRHWQIARIQRLTDEQMMHDPELRSLARRVDAKINALRDGEQPPVEPVPGPESHGPAGHPSEINPKPAPNRP